MKQDEYTVLDLLHVEETGCGYAAYPFDDGSMFCNKCGWAWRPAVINAEHLERQRDWSSKTFGVGARTLGVLNHIRSELDEIEADPADLEEWVDVMILAFDGAWRAGWEPQEIIDAIITKQTKNEARTWPDWRTMSPDQAIEHDRSEDI